MAAPLSHYASTICSDVTLAGGHVCVRQPPDTDPTLAAEGLTASGCAQSLCAWTSGSERTVPLADAIPAPPTAISVVIGLSRCGFTTVSVSSFGFDAEIDAEPESPASMRDPDAGPA